MLPDEQDLLPVGHVEQRDVLQRPQRFPPSGGVLVAVRLDEVTLGPFREPPQVLRVVVVEDLSRTREPVENDDPREDRHADRRHGQEDQQQLLPFLRHDEAPRGW